MGILFGTIIFFAFLLMAFWLLIFIFGVLPGWIFMGIRDILKEKFGGEAFEDEEEAATAEAH